MKKGYSVDSDIPHSRAKFILVANYNEINEVHNFAVMNHEIYMKNKYVGVWKIKNKN